MGNNEYGLKSLGDDQLLSGLASIVRRRNQVTAEFLSYLAELDERQLFLDLGFSSLFEYCVETLRLCESTAGRHIAAARVCRNHPEAFALVASGALHASALSLLRKYLTSENAGELFEFCTHRSARKVEELLAARFPRPDVRDLVRRLPARTEVTLNVESTVKRAPIASSPEREMEFLSPTPLTELETKPASALPLASSGAVNEAPAKPLSQAATVTLGAVESESRRLEPLSADRYGVHFTADGEFCALLERVRGLAAHRLPSGDLMTLFKRGLEAYERELEKERFAVGTKSRRGRETARPSGARSPNVRAPQAPSVVPSANPHRKRHHPTAVARAVFLRDGKQCSYVSPDGRRCGATRRLEVDHIEPFAVGGEDTIENMRLLCQAHNQRHARRYFGARRMNEKILNARRQREAKRGASD
jgi:5-methylcytosine-specific restriction endonuclease McrA